jgi:L-lactate dehydrogenase complex protein LldG
MASQERDDEAADLEERVKEAARERKRWDALRRAFATTRSKQATNIQRMKDLDERTERLQRVREESLLRPELILEAITNMEAAGFRVRQAVDAKEAVDIVMEEMGDERLLVKSKTNVSKEVHLAHEMEERGFEVVETDLGDRIIQIADLPGAHPTGPAAHLDRYDIAKILSEYAGRELEPDPRKLTDFVLDDLNDRIDRARVGLTGANSIGAEEGAVLIIHNEGNITKVSMRPWKHIILTSIDKVFPNLDEGLNAARLQTFYATGAVLTSYINIIGGPSKTADIEKKLFSGIHGPEEVVVVLLDNDAGGVQVHRLWQLPAPLSSVRHDSHQLRRVPEPWRQGHRHAGRHRGSGRCRGPRPLLLHPVRAVRGRVPSLGAHAVGHRQPSPEGLRGGQADRSRQGGP